MEEQQLEAVFRASNLIIKFLKGILTPQEQTELNAWIEADPANRLLFDSFTNTANLNSLLNEFYKINRGKDRARKKIKRRLFVARTKIRSLTARVWRYVA